MDIARYAIRKPVNTWLLVLICLLGGIWAILTLGRLEDPAFTVKMALVVTPYPGATAEEVELEVTEHMESAIQQMPQLKRITSKSMPGRSEITIEIEDSYTGPQIPQIWDELRRKVGDAQPQLPPGAGPSMVQDDFGDVFGMFYAVTAPGFSDREVRDIARLLRRELLTVHDVAKVEVQGLPPEAIYVDIPNQRLTTANLPLDLLINTIQTENTVRPAGAVRIDDLSVRISAEPGLDTVNQVEALRIGRPGSTNQISLMDVATVSRQQQEIPSQIILHNGERAFTVAVAGVADSNIVDIGRRVDAHLDSLSDRIPLGVELQPIYQQHEVVDDSIGSFITSLALSISIVIGVLCLFMGWRVGLVVGITLGLTVMGTLFMMRIFGIEMERISLGALIIAMGMLVDNAIVVAEGMLINMQRGMKATRAASEAVKRTQTPLLGATLIGILAFSGIGLSQDTTGEFLFSLFAVIGISLLLSWLLAITITPLYGKYLLRVKDASADRDPYKGLLYGLYRTVLRGALRFRLLTVAGLILVTGTSFWAFGMVKQSFFPDSNTPLFYVNYLLPQGADIRATARDVEAINDIISAEEEVVAVTAYAGQGASRFMLTYEPEQPNPAYGHFIIRVDEREQIPDLARRLRERISAAYPAAEVRTQRIVFGPPAGAEIEARFQGDDPAILRDLANEAERIMRSTPDLVDIRQDWRQRALVIDPVFNEERARVAGISRNDLARTLEFATTGIQAGLYREGEEFIPIILRPPADERLDPQRLQERMIWSSNEQRYVPVTQVVDGFQTRAEESLILRRERARTLTVQAGPSGDLTADQVFRDIRPRIEAIELPPGYRLQWGGEYEASGEAQESLGSQLPLSFLSMLVISVLIFGSVRQPIIIWLVVPMSICGVVAGLLLSGLPFTFTALLGYLSLSGMLMKNAIVLVDEIDEQRREGKSDYPAVLDASVSRLRPVFLAATTTILGMIPLLADAFFASMAVTIMGGLAFASILTLVAVPVFYSLFFRIRPA